MESLVTAGSSKTIDWTAIWPGISGYTYDPKIGYVLPRPTPEEHEKPKTEQQSGAVPAGSVFGGSGAPSSAAAAASSALAKPAASSAVGTSNPVRRISEDSESLDLSSDEEGHSHQPGLDGGPADLDADLDVDMMDVDGGAEGTFVASAGGQPFGKHGRQGLLR